MDVGHNSGNVAEPLAGDRLRSFVERYERIDEEVAERRADQKDLMQEVASAGFDKKVVRQLIRIRKMDPGEVEETEALLVLYKRAVGM